MRLQMVLRTSLSGMAIGAVLFGMTACTETQLAVHVAKKVSQSTQPSAGERKIQAERVRRASMRPYTIQGVRYTPVEDPEYDETGIASWYGEPFHGRATSTGEIFDMNKISAAHKTLPLPATVEVTNLENGRILTVRVNDRGPFVQGRIIDLSRRAAQLLGFEKDGVARVRVRLASSPDDQFVMRPVKTAPKERTQVAAAPRATVSAEPLPGVEAPKPAIPETARVTPPAPKATAPETAEIRRAVPPPTQIFVQAGAFSDYQNALRLRARLAALGDVAVSHALVRNRDFYRVRVGPLADVAAADRTLARVISTGTDDARIVVE
ncbi:MAG: septal ring lytic transglycosylase RlpA family protein [Minwuia sp.]|uniref:septal ring lytic transglycosylase RlpA family protein n=1 Tax=Minwuia sp. TaxID=2493630 RepID=UPI003A88C5F5